MNQSLTVRPKKSSKVNRLVRLLHVYTSMLMLLVMLFFTLTGLTLNHRDWFADAPAPERLELPLPQMLAQPELWREDPLAQAEQVRRWLSREYQVLGNQVSYEWEADSQLMVIDVKRPGGYSLAEVDLESASVLLEKQTYGAVATLNDLHMGRYSGALWSGFIDLSAVAMLLFTLTGFWLVLPQKKKRQRLISLSLLGSGLFGSAYLWVILT
ncbi:PepSY-associated TM helix domain-containing protein [Neptuniibacter halophilus]|uniref:PepSY-associated TM helix domain-containing protein n=1 Tax=Neptuniibacter halophilus TaxID=651666 RepID=UPI0025746C09|nr:PepSY-associated TM helix domain-containing protein [Neptuniibacter halophilus]